MLKIPVTQADHYQGRLDAPVILVEYGDYECPYCGLAYPIIKRIQKHFGDKLCFIFRNFPIVDSHPHAKASAVTAEYAATEGKFWEIHDMLYENQTALELPDLLRYIKNIGLEKTGLEKAFENDHFEEKINTDFMGGIRSGVNGTPSFFINGSLHRNSFEYSVLLDAINLQLKASKEVP